MIEYESFVARQRVRVDGRIVGYVERLGRRRWRALTPALRPVGDADCRRDATALLLPIDGAAEAPRARLP